MATEINNTSEDTDMTDYDDEKVVTMVDVLKEQEDFDEDANAVLGASDDKNCTYSNGYIKRQAIYACMTCCPDAKSDPSKRAGVCLACSLMCHENHELIELYTKRNFKCDCGNSKFNSHPCQFTSTKEDINEDNMYNQNFSGIYCICHRPYPDPESTVEDEMIQCIICEDWLHASHLDATVPDNEQYSEMICRGCMETNEFLHDYSIFAVKTENIDLIITNGINDNDKELNVEDVEMTEGNIVLNVTEKLNGITEKCDAVNKEVLLEKNDRPYDGKEENNIKNEINKDSLTQLMEDVESEQLNPNVSLENDSDTSTSAVSNNPEFHNTIQNIESKAENSDSNLIDHPIKDIISESNQKDFDDQSDTKNIRLVDTQSLNTENKNELNVDKTSITETVNSTENNLETQNNLKAGSVNDVPIIENTNIKESDEQLEEELLLADPDDVKTPDLDQENNTTNSVIQETDKKENTSQPDANEATDESSKDTTITDTQTSDPNEKKINSDVLNNVTEIVSNEQLNTTENVANNETNTSKHDSEDVDMKDSSNEKTNEIESASVTKPNTEVTDSVIKTDGEADELATSSNIKSSEKQSEEESNDTEVSDNVIKTDIRETENIENSSLDDRECNEASTSSKENISEKMLSIEESINKDENIETATSSVNKDVDSSNEKTSEKRRLSIEENDTEVKKIKLDLKEHCKRPKGITKVYKGATFWPSTFRQSLCTCSECITMYKDLSVLFLIDLEDTVTAYEALGQQRINGKPATQYEKGLQALSSLDRTQQINALTEYNNMRDKLLDFLKTFKNKREVVKEEDIKAFFAGIKPTREPDGVYFCK